MYHNVILTWPKTPQEYFEFNKWITEHNMYVENRDNLRYYVRDDEDAILFKLRWGA